MKRVDNSDENKAKEQEFKHENYYFLKYDTYIIFAIMVSSVV